MHLAAKPGMPWIKNFPYLGPMGVVLFRCTTEEGCIRPWATRAPWHSRKVGVASKRRRRHNAGAMGGAARGQGQLSCSFACCGDRYELSNFSGIRKTWVRCGFGFEIL